MTLYIGVDFHPHQQNVAGCDLQTGEIKTQQLLHNTPAVKAFYTALPQAVNAKARIATGATARISRRSSTVPPGG